MNITKHILVLALLINFLTINVNNEKPYYLENSNDDFKEFIKLFKDVKLPYSKSYREEDEGKYMKIPNNFLEKHFKTYVKDDFYFDGDVYALGKFEIGKRYYGLVFGFGGYVDGYSTFLVIYTKDGKYKSHLMTGYYYEKSGNFNSQDTEINKKYELSLISKDSGSEDGNSEVVNQSETKYFIKDGVILKKK